MFREISVLEVKRQHRYLKCGEILKRVTAEITEIELSFLSMGK